MKSILIILNQFHEFDCDFVFTTQLFKVPNDHSLNQFHCLA